MRNILLFLLGILWAGAIYSSQSVDCGGVFISKNSNIRSSILQQITPFVKHAIAEKHYPGAVILVGHRDQIIYQGVFGHRVLLPVKEPMCFNTIFDLASLTKVIATTPAVMQLIEQGKLSLDKPVAYYWPEFGANGKEKITVRQLLTHQSGLPADIDIIDANPTAIYHQIEKIKLIDKPKEFVYSDVNFIVLAHLVEIISGENFAEYTQKHIFKPLGMKDTYFNPPSSLNKRIAPTEKVKETYRRGQPQDPLAFVLGGVSGNAGLFSTAHDLSLFAQSLLNGGRIPGTTHYFLSPLSVLKMTTPQTPPNDPNVRGLGWDIDSPYSNRGTLLPVHSFGHTGWTGTSIWIDPTTQTYIIILTSRLHPVASPHNPLIEDRKVIADFVAASLIDIQLSYEQEKNTGFGELTRAYKNLS